jgi:glycosyltransferase involved in cell wall biosynthesis
MEPHEQMVSVVMPTLNQARFIDDAIASVLGQSHAHLELVVADGGSTDGTQALLERWQRRDPRLHWFSGPDTGPADALNKGMRAARGTLVGWLNSDDLYTEGAVERAVAGLSRRPDWIAVYGRARHVDADGRALGDYPTKAPPVDAADFLDGCFVCQPTLFFRRTLYVMLGEFDSSLQTAFDFEYWLRLFTSLPGRIGFVDSVQALSRLHDACITRRMRRAVALEGLRVLRRHLRRAPAHWVETHIGEILAGTPAADAGPAQRAEIAGFIEEAAACLAPDDHAYFQGKWGV